MTKVTFSSSSFLFSDKRILNNFGMTLDFSNSIFLFSLGNGVSFWYPPNTNLNILICLF